jgi:hypothetical protein
MRVMPDPVAIGYGPTSRREGVVNSGFHSAWWVQIGVAVLAAAFLVQVVISLKSGVLPLKGSWKADRRDGPTAYWLMMLIYGGVGVLLAAIAFGYIITRLHQTRL